MKGGIMHSSPLVSFLMSAYNAGNTIARSIESMIDQTYENIEIIIILEAECNDSTYDICDNFAVNDNRIRVYKNETRLGIAKSLNKGLGLCSGRYIARFDADDVCMLDRIEKQVAYMELNPDIGLIGSQMRHIDKAIGIDRITNYLMGSELIKCNLLFSTAFAHPTIMMRSDIVKAKNIFYPLRVSEDYGFFVEIVKHTKLNILPDALIEYHAHGSNDTVINQNIVRTDSVNISRQHLSDTLGVNTSVFHDSYFGWRPVSIEIDPIQYVVEGLKLLDTVRKANANMRYADEAALDIVLERHWQDTTYISGVGSLITQHLKVCKADDITEYLERYRKLICEYSRVIVYGIGEYAMQVLSEYENELFHVEVFADSNPEKTGGLFLGKEIISPDNIPTYEIDYVLIATMKYAEEVFSFLIESLLIDEEKILYLPKFCELIKLKQDTSSL